MKKLLLIVIGLFFLTSANSFAQLIGGNIYQVNGTEAPPLTFQSITTAVNYMTTNGVSGSGQVILELNTGYAGEPGPVTIGPITGASSSLGIIFRPATGYTANTTIAGGASPNQHAINLAGCSYITLDGRSGGAGSSRNWTVKVTGSGTSGLGQMAVRLNNTSGSMTGIHIRNLIMIGEAANVTGAVFQITGNTANTIQNVIIEENYITSTASASTDTRGYGITVATATNVNNTGLIVRNNEITNVYARGMNLTAAYPQAQYYGNKVYHTIPITQPGTVTEFAGIYYSSTSANGVGTEIYNNMVYGIQLTNHPVTATTGVNGFMLVNTPTSGDRIKIYNNIVSIGQHLTGTAATANVYGIRDNTAASNLIDIFYNSVYIGGEAASGSNNSAAFRKQLSNNINLSNNVFYNVRSNNGGTGTHWGIMTNNTSFTSISNNDYYATGTGGVLGTIDGTTAGNQLTIGLWQTAVGGDPGSISFNPNFVNPAASPPDLKINTAIATPLESGAIIITGINADFEGNPRYPNPGYPFNPSYPPTAPDIGADEFAGQPADISAPIISYTALSNTSSTSNRSLTAEIVDVSGVQTGTNGPRLYYKKSTDPSYIFDNNPSISGNDYTFTLNTAALGGVATGTIIQYYVAAQDINGNASTNPAGGSGSSPPGTTPPGSPNSYAVVPSLSGTYTVGTGGDYVNLTAIANVLNNQGSEVTGNVIFELMNTYDGTTGETVPIVFNEFENAGALRGAPYTVTIRPAAGVTNRITSGDPGANFSFPVIDFVGGKNYILDGRPGGVGISHEDNEWTIRNIRNSGTIGCVIRFADDGAYNTIRNLNLESQATLTTTGVIFFHISTGTIGNSFNSVLFNNIRPRTDAPTPSISNGILSNGSLAAPNSANIISDNHIINFNNIAISLVTTNTGNGPDWTISNNHIYNPTHVSATAQTGISIASPASTNMLISGNFIGGNAPGATGTMTNSGNVVLTGISVTNGIADISDNTIANMTSTNTGTTVRTRGIFVTSGNDSIKIMNNTVTNLSSSGSITSGYTANNQVAVGISVWPGSVFYYMTIIGNTVGNISAENTTAFTSSNMSAGMFITNFTGVCANNKIYGIKNKSTGTTSLAYPMACGIYSRFFSSGYVVNNMISLGQTETTNTQFNGIFVYAAGSPNNHYYYYNSIEIGGTTSGNIGSYGFVRGDDTTTFQIQTQTLRDNIISVTRSGGTAVNYAIANKGSAAASGWSSNYNDLYNPSGAVGYWNNAGHTFPGWQIASSGDANSVSENVFFVNAAAGDLHLTGTSNGDLDLRGTPIAGITTDFDGDPRNEVYPYMGADEASVPLPVELASFTASVDKRDVHLNWTTESEINNSGFDVERKAKGSETWSKAGFVEGSGTTSEARNYAYIDKGLNAGKYNYRLKQVDFNGNFEYLNLTNEVIIGVPEKYDISQNYPNPFNPVTRINFDLPFDSKVAIKIFDITGREITTLVNDVQPAGYYTVTFDARNIASGMYFYRIVAEGGSQQYVMTKKMMVIK